MLVRLLFLCQPMTDMAAADIKMRHGWRLLGPTKMTRQTSGWICVGLMIWNVGAGRRCVEEKDDHYNCKNSSDDADNNQQRSGTGFFCWHVLVLLVY